MGGIAWRLYHQACPPEVVRKVVHVGVGNIILLAWALGMPWQLGVAASLLFCPITLVSYVLPLLPGLESVGRKSFGTFFYALSFGCLMAWFWPLGYPQFAVAGILTMTWGDGLAALVGQRWGRHPYEFLGMRKSWEGSFTMAIVSALVIGAVLMTLPLPAVVILGITIVMALVATALETISILGFDNLTVPLGTAACGFWLSQLYL